MTTGGSLSKLPTPPLAENLRMRVAAASLHPVAVDDARDLPQQEQPTPATLQAPRTTLRFEADPTRPATITTEARKRGDQRRPGQLERELDRLQASLAAEQTSFGQQLTWLLLSQGLLLNAFVVLLVLGWSAPLPGRRLVLAGLALVALTIAVFITLALRGTGDGLHALAKARRDIESRLEKDHGRAPIYAALAGHGLARTAARLLPATFIAGWLALSLYALGLPPGVAGVEDAGAASAQARAPAPAAPIRNP